MLFSKALQQKAGCSTASSTVQLKNMYEERLGGWQIIYSHRVPSVLLLLMVLLYKLSCSQWRTPVSMRAQRLKNWMPDVL